MFSRSVFVPLSFFVRPLGFLSFDLRLLITKFDIFKHFLSVRSNNTNKPKHDSQNRFRSHVSEVVDDWLIDFVVFNVTFSNISAISWRPVLVVEETGVPGENHRPWGSNLQTLSLAAASRVHPFCNLQNQGANPSRIGGMLVWDVR